MKNTIFDRMRRIELVELLRRTAALPRLELHYLVPPTDPDETPPEQESLRHQHDFYELMFLSDENGCIIRTARPGVVHDAALQPELSKRIFTVWLLQDRFFCVIENKLAMLSYYTPHGAIAAKALTAIIDAGALLAQTGEAECSLAELGHNVVTLILEVVQMLSDDVENSANIVEKAISTIHENYSSGQLTAEKIAAASGRSLQCLNTRFRRELGTTVRQYLMDERLRAAAFALRHTSSSIATIAKGCGWNDVAYFSNSFRRRYGVSPAAFRAAGESAIFPD